MKRSQITPRAVAVRALGAVLRKATGFLLPFAAILLAHPDAELQAQRRADILLIQTDDQPYHTLKFLPQTRALIGDQGVTFGSYYVSTSICGPSRATTLTGLYSHHTGVEGNPQAALIFEDTNTLPVWLKAAGYRTALVGKYLNGYDKSGSPKTFPAVPPGWDYWRAMKVARYYGVDFSEDGRAVRYDSTASNYSTTLLRDFALAFLRDAPARKPLFLYFAPNAPHQPATPAPEDVGSFSTLPRWNPPSYNETDVSDKPAWVRALPLADDQRERRQYEHAAEALQAVDRAVADLIAAAEARGRPLYVIFTSDNGWSLGAHRYEAKWCPYEECSKEPLLVRGPGIPAGVTIAPEKLAANVDLAPTIADLAGAPVGLVTDGRSLRRLLERPSASWTRDVLLENRGGGNPVGKYSTVRTANGWEWTEYANGDRELYDLNADPYQLDNLANEPGYSAVGDSLAALLEDLK